MLTPPARDAQSFEDEAQIKSLASLVAPILGGVTALLQKGLEQDARDVLIDLSDVAELEAALFKPHYAEHTATLLQAACNDAFDSETRQAALELVIAIVEAKPGLMRKDGRLVAMLCEALMGLLLDIEDTETWHAAVEEQHLDDGALRRWSAAPGRVRACVRRKVKGSLVRTAARGVQGRTSCTTAGCKGSTASRGPLAARCCSRTCGRSWTRGAKTGTGASATRRSCASRRLRRAAARCC